MGIRQIRTLEFTKYVINIICGVHYIPLQATMVFLRLIVCGIVKTGKSQGPKSGNPHIVYCTAGSREVFADERRISETYVANQPCTYVSCNDQCVRVDDAVDMKQCICCTDTLSDFIIQSVRFGWTLPDYIRV